MSWVAWKKKFSKTGLLAKRDPELLFSIMRSKIQTAFFPSPAGKIVKEIDGLSMELDLSSGPQTKAMYYDAYEPVTIKVMKKYLKRGNTFIDVGASIGYLSLVAASLVGKEGQVHSFEPFPRDFARLKEMSERNPGFRIFVQPYAAGDEAGEADLDISNLKWVGWNTLVPGFMRKNVLGETRRVKVIRLDHYLIERKDSIGNIGLIKIDTEGYESKVLQGLENFFEAHRKKLPPVLCEVTPRVHALLGTSLSGMADYMKGCGFRAVSLFDEQREVDLTQLDSMTDVLFLPRN